MVQAYHDCGNMEVPLLSESELEEFSIEEDGPESALSIPKADDASTVAGMSSSASGKMWDWELL